MDAILLAAGLGKRMAPLTPAMAKPLLPVAGRTLLHRMLSGLAGAGVGRVHVVLGHRAEEVRAEAEAWRGPAEVRFAVQDGQHGTGHAVAAAAPSVRGDALVVMGDCIVAPEALQALAEAEGFVVASAQVADPRRYGVLRLKGDRVVAFEEKPEAPSSDQINAGLYRIPADDLSRVHDLQVSPRGELEFTDLVHGASEAGRLRAVAAPGWIDVGAPWDLLDAQAAVLGGELDRVLEGAPAGGPGTIEDDVRVRGRLFVGEGAVVRSGTYVQGDVLVGAGADVGPNAYVRGPVCIGAGCRVGAASEVKASLLMDGANAPHHNYVGDSVLGPGVNLGSGTKLANLRFDHGQVAAGAPSGRVSTGRAKFGAALGPLAQTGINASLLPGTMLEEGAWVGAGQTVGGWVAARA